MKKRLLLIIFLLNTILLTAQTETKHTMEKWLKENNIPVLGLGVIENGKPQKIEVFGDIKPNEKAPYNTIFNVASITKTVTAVVALKLISQGKWKLDEPLYNYWIDPDIATNPNTKLITTRYVLTHQTGFPNWRRKNKLNFMFTPGTKCSYSGEGFEYLRLALEKKFGKTLNELATALIFEPLHMKDTQFIWNLKIDESRVADGFNKEGVAYETYKRKISNGADDLLTTIEDYGIFLTSVMKGEGLSKEVFKEMQSNQVVFDKKHFGLGFIRYNFKDGNYAISHSGGDKGVSALMVMLPKTKKGVVIFTNADNGYKAYDKILTQYLGKYGEEIMEIEMGKKTNPEVKVSNEIRAYEPVNEKLYDDILKMDLDFFDAYNSYDLDKQANIYADNIEFFHDKGGYMTSKKDILNSTKKYICGKVKRELIKESVEVYPISDYGAVEIGFHKFINSQEPDAESIPFKFIMIWSNKSGEWKIKKVISLH